MLTQLTILYFTGTAHSHAEAIRMRSEDLNHILTFLDKED